MSYFLVLCLTTLFSVITSCVFLLLPVSFCYFLCLSATSCVLLPGTVSYFLVLCLTSCVFLLLPVSYFLILCLTSRYGVPVGSIDDVVVAQEVLVVTGPAVWVGHHLVGAGVHRGQPAEEAFIGRRGVLARGPVPRHVERVGDHQLPPVEISPEDEWNVLDPVDDSAGL